jgi:hypothetical protein
MEISPPQCPSFPFISLIPKQALSESQPLLFPVSSMATSRDPAVPLWVDQFIKPGSSNHIRKKGSDQSSARATGRRDRVPPVFHELSRRVPVLLSGTTSRGTRIAASSRIPGDHVNNNMQSVVFYSYFFATVLKIYKLMPLSYISCLLRIPWVFSHLRPFKVF